MNQTKQVATHRFCIKAIKHLPIACLAFSSFFTSAVFSQNADENRIQELEQRLLELEQQVQKQSTKPTNSATAQNNQQENPPLELPKTEQRSSHDFSAPDKSIVLSNSDTTLQIGGQIWLDAIYNNGEMTNRAGFQPSAIAYEEGTTTDKTLFHVGQSNLSFKSYTPTKYGVMKTRFEFDMFDAQGDAVFHLTHLWGEVGNFGAGQTFSGFMDINSFPNILDYWGPNSMMFSRQPQVRYTTEVSVHSKLMFTIEKPGSDFAIPENYSGTEYNDITELPDLTASYFYNNDFGYIKSAFILRKLGYKTATTKDTTLGWGINVSGKITVATEDSINFQIAHGKGIGRYVNDACCSYYSDETGGVDGGLDANGNLVGIPVTAGFLYYNKQWNSKWSSAIGYSYMNIDNLETQKSKALKNSSYSNANIIWYPADQLKAGIEVMYGDVQSHGGFESDDYRIQGSVGFKY